MASEAPLVPSSIKPPRVYSTNPLAILRRNQREMAKSKRQAAMAAELAISTGAITKQEESDTETETLVGDQGEREESEQEPAKEIKMEAKADPVGTSAIEVAEFIMKQDRAFLVELVDIIKKSDGYSWRLLLVMTGLKKSRKDDDDNDNDEDDLAAFEMGKDMENAVPDDPLFAEDRQMYLGRKAPPAKLMHCGPSEASSVMNLLHDTLNFHRAGRAHSDKVAVLNNQQLLSDYNHLKSQCQEDWENGRPEVKKLLSETKIMGMRGYMGMRRAFDHIVSKIGGPTLMWNDSDQWFRASIEIIECNQQYALLLFEPNTRNFLHAFKDVIKLAEKEALLKWLSKKSFEEYADLMGTGYDTTYEDNFKPLPDFQQGDRPSFLLTGFDGVYQDAFESKSKLG